MRQKNESTASLSGSKHIFLSFFLLLAHFSLFLFFLLDMNPNPTIIIIILLILIES